MICNSGTAFAARVDGRRLSFEEEGIFNGVFVMRDRQTKTLWSHFTGEAFDGPLKGKQLEWIPLDRATYSRAVDTWPDATAPAKHTMRFRGAPTQTERSSRLGESLPGPFVPTLPKEVASKLPRHTHGVGVAVGSSHRFFPLERLFGLEVANDEVGGTPVVVMLQDGSASAAVYGRCVDGRTLDFERAEHAGRAALRDTQTKTVWSATGEAVSGPLKGERLSPARAMITDWYGWGAYFPKSTVWSPPK